jgi:hypothetical protein
LGRFQPWTQIHYQTDQALILPGLERCFVIQARTIHFQPDFIAAGPPGAYYFNIVGLRESI